MLSCVLTAVEGVGENLPYGTKLGDRRDTQQVRQLIQTYSPLTFANILGSDRRRRKEYWKAIWSGGRVKEDKANVPGIIGG